MFGGQNFEIRNFLAETSPFDLDGGNISIVDVGQLTFLGINVQVNLVQLCTQLAEA